jgi:hypothetical protein
MIETTAGTETPAERKRRVNNVLCGLPRRREAERIAFFCECEREGCCQAVWLTSREYDLVRVRSGWGAVIDGHRVQAGLG